MHVSMLHPYSLAIVAYDKPQLVWDIDAFPVEILPFTDGDINNLESYKKQIQSISKEVININAKKENLIHAKWLPLNNGNRVSPPDVVAGETVMLYQYGDEDRFAWATINYEANLRKLETIYWVFSNNSSFGSDPANDKNSYFILMDTRNKLVRFHIADTDGEHCTYDIKWDTKKGDFIFTDGKGNFINLASFLNTLNINLNKDLNALITETINLKNTDTFIVHRNLSLHRNNSLIVGNKAINNYNEETNLIKRQKQVITKRTRETVEEDNKIEQLKQEIKQYKNKIKNKDEEIDNFKEVIKKYDETIEEMKSTINKLESTIKEATIKIDNLTATYGVAEFFSQSLNASIGQSELIIPNLKITGTIEVEGIIKCSNTIYADDFVET